MRETGYYYRVERNGKWLNVLLEDLTDEERSKICRGDAKFLLTLLNAACNVIQEMKADALDTAIERDFNEP